ncbi:MAG: phosphofructokinase, partial [Minicystis sp.]
QLAAVGLVDRPDHRVIAEPFSRYIRGVRPAFLDVSSAFLKASLLFAAFDAGRTEIMPYVLASHDAGVRPFSEVDREDGVEPAFLPLLDRLGIAGFQAWIQGHFLRRAQVSAG